jgi:guanylate kinase
MEFLSNNKIFIVTAPSGSGKTVVMRSVMNNELVSFTTRTKREKEVEGIDYIFISELEFEKLLNTNGLIENTNYGGNYYGLTREELNSKLALGDVFFICDVVGMKQIKKIYPNTVSIFIYSSKEDCESNMRDRGDTEQNIHKRLSTYETEIENLVLYDHVVTNARGFLEDTINDVKDIIYDI